MSIVRNVIQFVAANTLQDFSMKFSIGALQMFNKQEFRENWSSDSHFSKGRKLILTCHFGISWSMAIEIR